ncbi:MAG: alpha/beta hydrolase [Bacteroidota bacterium]
MKEILWAACALACLTLSCKQVVETPEPGPGDTPIVYAEATYDIQRFPDITYAEGLSHDAINSPDPKVMPLLLDAYVPDNELTKRPAMLLIHGGGFQGGSRKAESIVNLCEYFTARGWVTFSINYRLLDDLGTVPTAWVDYAQQLPDTVPVDRFYSLYPAARDAKAALRWLFANAETYGIDTDYITVGGGSAGAITATMLGITDAEDYTDEITLAEDPTLATANLGQATAVHSILDFWGSGLHVQMLEDVYGVNRYDETDAPILIMHGTEDPTVPFSDGEALRDRYTENGVAHGFYPLEGRGHGPWNATVDGQTLTELCFDFVVEQQGLTVE